MANKNHRTTPYVIALCHQKGGVAKTTTALSLSACFNELGLETLLMDLDPQGNSTSAMGMSPNAMLHSAADVLLGNGSLAGISRETATPGLDLIPSNNDMQTVERCLHLRTGFEYLLREQFSRSSLAHYKMVVIDCPPALGSIATTVLTACDMVIVPTQCEFFSMQGIRSTLKLINNIRAKTNAQLEARLLITMFDQRIGLHYLSLEHIRRTFKHTVFKTIIGVDGKLRESQMTNKLITTYAPHSRAAEQYRQLTQELLKYVQN